MPSWQARSIKAICLLLPKHRRNQSCCPKEAAALDLNPNLQPLTGVTIMTPTVPAKGSPDAATPAKTDINGERSLVRVFGLKLGKIVIDAGHGGHDAGTTGPRGLMEKDLVLDVSLRLGKMIEQQLGAQVVYTRSTDVFIPLEEARAHCE